MTDNEIEKVDYITEASVAYIEKTKLRASIQAIPYVGGSLDTLLSGRGAKYQSERFENFIKDLTERLQRLEGLNIIEPTEPLFDLMMQVFSEVIKTRSEEKRKYFANLVANQVVNDRVWDDVETVTRLLAELTDLHITLLQAALDAPECDGVFEGLRIITLTDYQSKDAKQTPEKPPTNISLLFPGLSNAALKMICSELIAKGLLHDEGIGRWGTVNMQYFFATPMAQWFMDWIAEPKTKLDD